MLTFSSFQKSQIIFEVRYDGAYLLWDRAGSLGDFISRVFRDVRTERAAPNQQVFFSGKRFTLSVQFDRASITDFSPGSSWGESFEAFEKLYGGVLDHLQLRMLNRVGTRFQYSRRFKSMEEARKQLDLFPWAIKPNSEIFRIRPDQVCSNLKVEGDDGEIGYTAQVYAATKRFELQVPPEAAALGADDLKHELSEIIFDVDCMTKKPIAVESFHVGEWLTGWQRAINKDADSLLRAGVGKS